MLPAFNNCFLLYLAACFSCTFPSCQSKESLKPKRYFREVCEAQSIPVAYDFDNLGLYLNSSIHDPKSVISWQWNYMSAEKALPDSSGIDYYMDRTQPDFVYNNVPTIPALFVTTSGTRIIEFSATILFQLTDTSRSGILAAMDSLTLFGRLTDPNVREALIAENNFILSTPDFTEQLQLEIQPGLGLEHLTYTLKKKRRCGCRLLKD